MHKSKINVFRQMMAIEERAGANHREHFQVLPALAAKPKNFVILTNSPKGKMSLSSHARIDWPNQVS